MKKFKHSKRRRLPFKKEEIIFLLEDYKKGINTKDLSKKYNSHIFNINKILRDNNVIRVEDHRKYTVNDDYFENIDSKDKAYFLGLMVSDGCNMGKLITLALQEEDGYIVKYFMECLNYNGKFQTIPKRGNTKSYNKIVITSKKLCGDLEKYGVVPRKSNKTYFPEISEEFYSHFIRGVFDGDGSISISKKKKSLRFNIFGNIELIEKIQNILIENCSLNKTKLSVAKNCSLFTFVSLNYVGTRQVSKIYKYLYKDCEDLYLKRKKEKFELQIH